MTKKMDLEFIQDVARVSKSLSALREELERYYKEDYLHKTKVKHPWISVRIGHHPTYLKDFIVSMRDDNLRDSVVKTAIKQIKLSIKELEKELKELMERKNQWH